MNSNIHTPVLVDDLVNRYNHLSQVTLPALEAAQELLSAMEHLSDETVYTILGVQDKDELRSVIAQGDWLITGIDATLEYLATGDLGELLDIEELTVVKDYQQQARG